MGYAFISYSNYDMNAAEWIRQVLTKNNVETWMAPYSIMPGASYGRAITDAIEGCSCFVLLLSNASQNSEPVNREVQLASDDYKKPFVVIQLEDLIINNDLKYYVGNKQIVLLKALNEESDEMIKIIDAVRSHTGSSPTITVKSEKVFNSVNKNHVNTAPSAPSPSYTPSQSPASDATYESKVEEFEKIVIESIKKFLTTWPFWTKNSGEPLNSKYAKAVKKCYPSVNIDDVIVFIDKTVFSSGKRNMVFTTNGLYTNDADLGKNFALKWNDILYFYIDDSNIPYCKMISGNWFYFHVTNTEIQGLNNIINEYHRIFGN